MNSKTKKQIQSKVIDYLKTLNPNFIMDKRGMFECPFKEEHEEKTNNLSCNVFPIGSNKLHCFDPSHGRLGDIFSIFKRVEPDMCELTEDEIGEYLIDLLDIKTDNTVNKLLDQYKKRDWCLFPLSPKSKIPIKGQKGWQKEENRNIEEWREWENNGFGLALNLGKKSKCVALDVDSDDTYEKIKHLIGDTLTQITKRGRHFIYVYEDCYNEINHANLRSKGYEMELRANNAYVVIAPTSVDGETRKWNDKEIIKMPEELKKLIFDLIEKNGNKKEENKDIKTVINDEDLKDINLCGLEGCCDDTFVKVGGILRKFLDLKKTAKVLGVFNKMLKSPQPYSRIKKMVDSLEGYENYDKKEMAEIVLEHLVLLEHSTARDLKDSLKLDKKDVEKCLDYLVKEDKIYKMGHVYRVMQKIEWQTNFMKTSKSLKIDIPFFSKYANFVQGSMLILGASTGSGKTHVSMNFVKQFVDKGITPYYFNTESTSGFGFISAKLGLKESDYYFNDPKKPANAMSIELEDDAVTIIDWLKPQDYAKMDQTFEMLSNQLRKHKGLLIVFVQIRKKTFEFFAPDLIDFYASLVAKYRHGVIKDSKGEITFDTENTYWKTEKIRDSKVGTQFVTIPTKFNRETKILTTREG